MQQKPFLYSLERCGEDNQDLYFKRLRYGPGNAKGVWATHLDIVDPTPTRVLILVDARTPREEIMHEINEYQTYFRAQVEPLDAEEILEAD